MTSAHRTRRLTPISIVSVICGGLTALGILVLLQQAGSVYPTRTITIVAAALGLLWGVTVPALARTVRARRPVR